MDLPQFDWEDHICRVAFSGLYGAENGDHRLTSTILGRQHERNAILDVMDMPYDFSQYDTLGTSETILDEWFEGTGFYFLRGVHTMLHSHSMALLVICDGPEYYDAYMIVLLNRGEMSREDAIQLFTASAVHFMEYLPDTREYEISSAYGVVLCETECCIFYLRIPDGSNIGLHTTPVDLHVTVGNGGSTFLNFACGFTMIWNMQHVILGDSSLLSSSSLAQTEDFENSSFGSDTSSSTNDFAL